MADILKVSTPLIEKTPINVRPPVSETTPFNLSDVTRVIQTHDPNEVLQQNTGFVPQDDSPRILADLLKDPSVTVGIMRNLYMMQEIIGLLPATNSPLTQEIEQMFEKLMLAPGDIAGEMERQELTTTMFKGELFDQLRSLLSQNANNPGFATSIGVLLKSLNASMSQSDTLQSVANNLQFVADNISNQSPLFDKLTNLIQNLRAPDATQQFPMLKEEVLAVLKDIQGNLLFSPQMEKTLPLVMYNLSRFNDNENFLPEALNLLLNGMTNETDKTALTQKLEEFLSKFSLPDGAKAVRGQEEDSRVMDIIAKIIGREAKSEELHLVSGDKMEKIVQSMLASPSNFTPLLHFIVPVEFMDMRAFAEMWIDPNAENGAETRGGSGAADNLHMLMVFDVEEIGRFEAELYVQGKRIAMNLLCPPQHLDAFKGLGSNIRKAVEAVGYSFEAINIDQLDRTHSLMEVFTDLPHKRTGINVKV